MARLTSARAASADELRRLICLACQRMGARPEDAERVSDLLVRSDLAGYESHGVFRLGQYHEWWRRGLLEPKAQPAVASETRCAAQVDGRLGFGQVAATFATRIAIEKAGRAGIATVTLRRSNHVGRLADYAQMIQEAGMIGLIMANDSGAGQVVAPFGGRDPRLSTNPIAVGIPGEGGGILYDFSTSAAAHGKVRQLFLQDQPAPDGWLIDAEGQPTRSPAVMYGETRGALLPAGAQRGYALGLTVEILAGILSGAGAANPCPGPEEMNGVFILAMEVALFLPLPDFRRKVGSLIAHVKSARPVPGGEPVRVPGERAASEAGHRAATGIPLSPRTWEELESVCEALGLRDELRALQA